MITFPEFIGRLGNHLFQMAATIGLAQRHGDVYGFRRWIHEKDFPISGCFRDNLPDGPHYQEPRFSYDPIPYKQNLNLHGYFQSEKYFSDCTRMIRCLFTPKGSSEETQESASLQVRRGDYLLLPEKHPILPMLYYEEAMDMLRERGAHKFMVFSDDLKWCRENFRGPDVTVIPDMGPVDQMKLSISCQHHVLANSTFSWWCAWLCPNPDKVVIAPRRWFGPGYSHYDTKDLLPSEWIVL